MRAFVGFIVFLFLLAAFTLAAALAEQWVVSPPRVAFSASEALVTPSAGESILHAENGVVAAQLNVTAAAEQARAAQFNALSAEVTADHAALKATEVAAVKTAVVESAEATRNTHWLNVTAAAEQSHFQMASTATAQAQYLIIESTRVALSLASTRTANEVAVLSAESANQMAIERDMATTQAKEQERLLQARIQAENAERESAERRERNQDIALSVGLFLLLVLVATGATFGYMWLKSQNPTQRVKVQGQHVVLAPDGWQLVGSPQLRLPAPSTTNDARPTERIDDLSFLQQDSAENKPRETYAVTLGINKDTGETIQINLRKAGHWLIAGGTGSGKTRFFSGVLCDLIANHTADELKLIIMDGKSMSFLIWQKIPHMMRPIATKSSEITEALRDLRDEMNRRNRAMKSLNEHGTLCENIDDYMRITGEKMPVIVAYIDEKAEAVVPDSEGDEIILTIARLGRSAGIVLVVSTQSLYAKNISGMLSTNCRTKIVFYLPDSRAKGVVAQIPKEFHNRMLPEAGLGYIQSPETGDCMFQARYVDNTGIQKVAKEATHGATPKPIEVPVEEPRLDWIDEVATEVHTTSEPVSVNAPNHELVPRILMFHPQAKSIRELARMVFNHPDGGGSYSTRVKAILDFLNMDYPS